MRIQDLLMIPAGALTRAYLKTDGAVVMGMMASNDNDIESGILRLRESKQGYPGMIHRIPLDQIVFVTHNE